MGSYSNGYLIYGFEIPSEWIEKFEYDEDYNQIHHFFDEIYEENEAIMEAVNYYEQMVYYMAVKVVTAYEGANVKLSFADMTMQQNMSEIINKITKIKELCKKIGLEYQLPVWNLTCSKDS